MSPVFEPRVLDHAPIHVRHVKLGASTDEGARQVLGKFYAPGRREGVNGEHGFIGGTLELKRQEEGIATLKFPNTTGADGVLHRDRFLITSSKTYREGDEWIEIYEGDPPNGDLLMVGTPINAQLTRTGIAIQVADAFQLLKLTRETAAADWHHAPRDVFEHYMRVWRSLVAADMDPSPGIVGVPNVAAINTSADGLWKYREANNQPGGVNLLGGSYTAGGIGGWLASTVTAQIGRDRTDHAPVRFETTLQIFGGPHAGDLLYVGLAPDPGTDQPNGNTNIYVLFGLGAQGWRPIAISQYSAANYWQARGNVLPITGEIRVAIEDRGRWTWFYVNGKLLAILPTFFTSVNAVPYVRFNSTTSGNVVRVTDFLLRRGDQLLLNGADKGDMRLPGSPAAGGLLGSYYQDESIATAGLTGTAQMTWIDKTLAPDAQPWAQRLDTTINFTPSSSPTWQPENGPSPAQYFSTRWVGSIYLDFDNYDYAFRFNYWDTVRCWIGDTRHNNPVKNQWASNLIGPFSSTQNTDTSWMKAGNSSSSPPSGSAGPLNGQKSGWYPIVIECSWLVLGAGLRFLYERSDAVGTWAVVPSTMLSPEGCHVEQPRYVSHYEQAKAVALAQGLDFTTSPRSLESGEFPGQVIPKIRVGRDTDVVITEDDVAGDLQVELDAQECVDTLLADAAGIADQAEGAQITEERINYDELPNHMLISGEYEQSSEISDPRLLAQRLDSLLTLRQAPWQTIQCRPAGKREFADSFPVIGSLSEFAWGVGDGVRLKMPTVGVEDITPRQLLTTSWDLRPDGRSAPQVTFRAAPRSFSEKLRGYIRELRNRGRNYQGQVVLVSGNYVSATAAVGAFSFCSLPYDLSKVIKATLVVQFKSDTSNWGFEVNSTAALSNITTPGRYDVTGWINRGNNTPYCFVRATPAGTGVIQYALELLVAV